MDFNGHLSTAQPSRPRRKVRRFAVVRRLSPPDMVPFQKFQKQIDPEWIFRIVRVAKRFEGAISNRCHKVLAMLFGRSFYRLILCQSLPSLNDAAAMCHIDTLDLFDEEIPIWLSQ